MKQAPFSSTLTPADLLIAHIAECANLTSIQLRCARFGKSDLKDFVAALPQLQTCILKKCSLATTALDAFSESKQLRAFSIWECRDLSVADLPLLALIQSLRELNID